MTELYIILFCGVMNRFRGHDFEGRLKFLDLVFGKVQTAVLQGLLIAAYLASPYVGIASAVTIRLYSSLGWGMYFISFSGDITSFLITTKERWIVRDKEGRAILDKEVPWIDTTVDFLFRLIKKYDIRQETLELFSKATPFPSERITELNKDSRLWGLIAMTLRGVLILPLLISLAYFTDKYYLIAPLLAFFMIAHGLVYYSVAPIHRKATSDYQRWLNRAGDEKDKPFDHSGDIAELVVGCLIGILVVAYRIF